MSAAIQKWTVPYSPGLLSKEQHAQFFEEGYTLVKDVFTHGELQPSVDSVNALVDSLARRLVKHGKVPSHGFAEAGFDTRLTLLEAAFPGSSVLLHKNGVLPPAIADLWSHPRLLSAAAQLLGPSLAGHPVWNLRCKTPDNEEATVPWHQDAAYLALDAWNVLQVTAWVPLVDATRVNGCMELLVGGHRSGKVAGHTGCAGNTWYIEVSDKEMGTLGVQPGLSSVVCEVPKGSVLLLNNLIPHRSLANNSNNIRWSLDLRWQRPTEPNGFHGLKDNILMTDPGNPGFKVDWAAWAAKSRSQLQQAAVGTNWHAGDGDDLDTTITGPWMTTWPLTHHNKHTRALQASGAAGAQ